MAEGVLKSMHEADEVILIRLYDEVFDPTSKVPISLLLMALPESERTEVETSYVGAIRAGLFDGSGLEFLSEGKWVPLSGGEFARAEAAFDAAMVRTTYILKTALPLTALRNWAAKFDLALPSRLTRVPANAAGLADGGPQTIVEPSVHFNDRVQASTGDKSNSRVGRPPHPDKGRMLQHARQLIESGNYASKEDRSQTKEAFVGAVHAWMKENAFCEYDFDYLGRLLQPLWRETRRK